MTMVRYERGFTLIELVVAAALVVVISAAVAAIASPMRRAFDRGLSAGEYASRGRTALHAIVSEVRNAGSGVLIGPTTVTLEDMISVVSVVSPSTVVITRASGPQGLLRDHVDAGAMSVVVDAAQPCSEQHATCGIRARDVVAIFDAAHGETRSVSGVDITSGTVHLASPLTHAFDAGTVIATIEHRTFTARDGQLLRITPGGAQQPIADRVLSFDAVIAAGRLDLRLMLESLTPGGTPFELRTSAAFRP